MNNGGKARDQHHIVRCEVVYEKIYNEIYKHMRLRVSPIYEEGKTMCRIVVTGGGWAGVSAAVCAKKAGAEVTLIEKTDLLLGAGNSGGIFRNNGRLYSSRRNEGTWRRRIV